MKTGMLPRNGKFEPSKSGSAAKNRKEKLAKLVGSGKGRWWNSPALGTAVCDGSGWYVKAN